MVDERATEEYARSLLTEPREEAVFGQWVQRLKHGVPKPRYMMVTHYQIALFKQRKADVQFALADLRKATGVISDGTGALELNFGPAGLLPLIVEGETAYTAILEAYVKLTAGWPDTALASIEVTTTTPIAFERILPREVPGGGLAFDFGAHCAPEWRPLNSEMFLHILSMDFGGDRKLDVSNLPGIDDSSLSLEPLVCALKYNRWFRIVKFVEQCRPDAFRQFAAVVAASEFLETLVLCDLGCKKGALELGQALASNSMSVLSTIDLSGNAFGNSGAAELAAGLQQSPCLTCLSLANTSLTEKGIQSIFQNVPVGSPMFRLRFLDLSYNKLGAKGTQCLSDWMLNPEVRDLHTLWLEDADVVLHLLLPGIRRGVHAVEEMNLRMVTGQSWCCDPVREALAASRVRRVNMAHGKVSAELAASAIEALARPVNGVPLPSFIDLTGILMRGPLKCIADSIRAGVCLVRLVMDDVDMRPDGLFPVLEALAAVGTIRYLSLCRSLTTKKGLRGPLMLAVAGVLGYTSNLEVLLLSGLKKYQPSEIMTLLQACSRTPRLVRLNLSQGNIGDSGVRALTTMLREKPNVTSLDILGNEISVESVEAISDAIRDHPCLKEFPLPALEDTKFKKEDAVKVQGHMETISSALARNSLRTLEEVSMSTESVVTKWKELYTASPKVIPDMPPTPMFVSTPFPTAFPPDSSGLPTLKRGSLFGGTRGRLADTVPSRARSSSAPAHPPSLHRLPPSRPTVVLPPLIKTPSEHSGEDSASVSPLQSPRQPAPPARLGSPQQPSRRETVASFVYPPPHPRRDTISVSPPSPPNGLLSLPPSSSASYGTVSSPAIPMMSPQSKRASMSVLTGSYWPRQPSPVHDHAQTSPPSAPPSPAASSLPPVPPSPLDAVPRLPLPSGKMTLRARASIMNPSARLTMRSLSNSAVWAGATLGPGSRHHYFQDSKGETLHARGLRARPAGRALSDEFDKAERPPLPPPLGIPDPKSSKDDSTSAAGSPTTSTSSTPRHAVMKMSSAMGVAAPTHGVTVAALLNSPKGRRGSGAFESFQNGPGSRSGSKPSTPRADESPSRSALPREDSPHRLRSGSKSMGDLNLPIRELEPPQEVTVVDVASLVAQAAAALVPLESPKDEERKTPASLASRKNQGRVLSAHGSPANRHASRRRSDNIDQRVVPPWELHKWKLNTPALPEETDASITEIYSLPASALTDNNAVTNTTTTTSATNNTISPTASPMFLSPRGVPVWNPALAPPAAVSAPVLPPVVVSEHVDAASADDDDFASLMAEFSALGDTQVFDSNEHTAVLASSPAALQTPTLTPAPMSAPSLHPPPGLAQLATGARSVSSPPNVVTATTTTTLTPATPTTAASPTKSNQPISPSETVLLPASNGASADTEEEEDDGSSTADTSSDESSESVRERIPSAGTLKRRQKRALRRGALLAVGDASQSLPSLHRGSSVASDASPRPSDISPRPTDLSPRPKDGGSDVSPRPRDGVSDGSSRRDMASDVSPRYGNDYSPRPTSDASPRATTDEQALDGVPIPKSSGTLESALSDLMNPQPPLTPPKHLHNPQNDIWNHSANAAPNVHKYIDRIGSDAKPPLSPSNVIRPLALPSPVGNIAAAHVDFARLMASLGDTSTPKTDACTAETPQQQQQQQTPQQERVVPGDNCKDYRPHLVGRERSLSAVQPGGAGYSGSQVRQVMQSGSYLRLADDVWEMLGRENSSSSFGSGSVLSREGSLLSREGSGRGGRLSPPILSVSDDHSGSPDKHRIDLPPLIPGDPQQSQSQQQHDKQYLLTAPVHHSSLQHLNSQQVHSPDHVPGRPHLSVTLSERDLNLKPPLHRGSSASSVMSGDSSVDEEGLGGSMDSRRRDGRPGLAQLLVGRTDSSSLPSSPFLSASPRAMARLASLRQAGVFDSSVEPEPLFSPKRRKSPIAAAAPSSSQFVSSHEQTPMPTLMEVGVGELDGSFNSLFEDLREALRLD